MNKLISATLGVVLGLCILQNNMVYASIPEGWRVADSEDQIDDWARFNSPNKITADFNGDGKEDLAQILLSATKNKGYKLIVQMSLNDQVMVFNLDQRDDIPAQSMAIELAEPSNEVWESAWEKGYWKCADSEIRQFKITKPSIQFCYIESSCSIYMWSDRKKDFINIPLSD